MRPILRTRKLLPTITALLTLAAVTLPAGAATAANAGTSGSVAAWPSEIARPAAASCGKGETPLVPTTGWTDKLGVSHFSYAAQPGMVVSLPPKGLTANKVTSAVLADLGLPSNLAPSSAKAKSVVSQVLNLSRKPSVRVLCRGTSPAALPVSRSPQGSKAAAPTSSSINAPFTHHYATNWAGYELNYGPYGNIINWVTGSWNVPGSHTSTTYAPSSEGTWIGIGGGDGETSSTWGLVQEGTSMSTGNGYRSWFELLGDVNNGCTNNSACLPVYESHVTPGDLINGEVYWPSQTQACFIFSDETNTGDSFDVCSGIPAGGIYDHTSAEWINESQVTSGYKYYDDPGTVTWTNQELGSAFGGGGTQSSPFAYSYESWVLLVPGTPFVDDSTPSPTCSNTGVESYPENAVNHGSWGSSDIVTCPTGFSAGEDGN